MRLSNWMTAKAIVVLIFGIGYVLIPGTIASLFGMTLDPAGTMMAQLFGAAFLFECVVLWLARNEPVGDTAVRAIVLAVVVSNAIGFIVTLLATLSGAMTVLGWLPVLLYLVFGLGFAYFLVGRRTA